MEPRQRSVASATSAARFYVAEQADREWANLPNFQNLANLTFA